MRYISQNGADAVDSERENASSRDIFEGLLSLRGQPANMNAAQDNLDSSAKVSSESESGSIRKSTHRYALGVTDNENVNGSSPDLFEDEDSESESYSMTT